MCGNPISIQPLFGANVIHILTLIRNVCFRASELQFQDFHST